MLKKRVKLSSGRCHRQEVVLDILFWYPVEYLMKILRFWCRIRRVLYQRKADVEVWQEMELLLTHNMV